MLGPCDGQSWRVPPAGEGSGLPTMIVAADGLNHLGPLATPNSAVRILPPAQSVSGLLTATLRPSNAPAAFQDVRRY